MKPSINHPPYQTKGVTYAKNGMVATANKIATMEALRVLHEGGNVFDAALVAASVENVTMPTCCQLGGDAFAIIYQAKEKKFIAINGSGIGQNVTIDQMLEKGYKKMPLSGAQSISLPGACDVYNILAHAGKLPLTRNLEPAIYYAQEGIILDSIECNRIRKCKTKIMNDEDCKILFTQKGDLPKEGELFFQKDLASTFKRIAKAGFRDFYEGDIAETIFENLTKKGAQFNHKDWKDHHSEITLPLTVKYRGYDILTTPPPSQGLILSTEMKIIEKFQLSDLGHNSTKSIHVMVEAKKLAFAARMKWAGDPRFVNIPWEEILGEKAICNAQKRIDMSSSMTKEEFQSLLPEQNTDTTSFVAVDGEGNAISFIHSLSNPLGSGVIAADTGITFNNRAGRGFVLQKNHPNCLMPGKRTMHTLLSWMLCKNGKPLWIGNTPGGDFQPQWGMQVISNLIDYNLNAEQAVSAPRWHSYPGTDPEHMDDPFTLYMEEGMQDITYSQLQTLGHNVEIIPRYEGTGAQQLIGILDNNILVGGSDPRANGDVLGF